MTLNQKKSGSLAEVIKRVLLYGILFLLLISAQSSFFSNLHICPATPDLLLGAVVAIILIDSKKAGVISAICAGVITDAIGGSGYSLSPLFFLLFAGVISVFSEKMLPVFSSYLILLIPAVIMKAAYTCLCIFAAYGSLPLEYTAKNILLPEAVCTFVLCLAVYPLSKLFMRPLGMRNRFSF